MKQKKIRPKQLSFRAALLLFCALLATLGMAVGLHARYTSRAVASDGARVAKFEITETGLGSTPGGVVQETVITTDLIPGETKTKKLTIQNKSEVAVEYTITVKNVTNNLPLTFEVSAKDESTVKVSAMSKDADSGEYSCSARLEPNETTANTYELKISWPFGEKDEYRSSKYIGMVDQVKVSISAIQID